MNLHNWKYQYKEYNPEYKIWAKQEIQFLKEQLKISCQIEHIGSSAVPGLGGKGVIDLYLFCSSNSLQAILRKLPSCNYEYKSNGGKKGKRWFWQKISLDNKKHKQAFHLHVSLQNNKDALKAIKFRDYLMNNSKAVKEYARVKFIASQKALLARGKKAKKKIYQNIKACFIDYIYNQLS